LFLTGEKKELMHLAVDSLKFIAQAVKPEERKDPNDLFVHTTTFMVVDKQGRMRQQAFQTTGEGVDFSKTQQEILALIRQLERER
jgi:cytochrome oxidase Cu insertion factor (SCO1/SenC/PrrC family)